MSAPRLASVMALLGTLLAANACFYAAVAIDPGAGGGGGNGGQGAQGGSAQGGGGAFAFTCGELFTDPAYADGCSDCIAADATCCAAEDLCLGSTACLAFADCVTEDMAPDELEGCEERHPDGAATFHNLYRDCFSGTCDAECVHGLWSCVGDYEWPYDDVPGQVRLAVDGVENLGLLHQTDIVARACEDADTDCDTPISEVFSHSGFALVDVQFPFRGFFEVDHPSFPPIRYRTHPIWEDQPHMLVVPTTAAIEFYAQLLAEPLDPTQGRMIIEVLNCLKHPARDVTMSLSGGNIVTPPTAYYVQNFVPITGATKTTSQGYVVYLNVPPGQVTYRGNVEGEVEDVVRGTVVVQAGTVTVVDAYPRQE